MSNLDAIGLKYGTDKASNGHDYLNLYEWWFERVRDKSINLLEIGVQFGNSLRTWQEYFSQAAITGVDVVDNNVPDHGVIVANGYTGEFIGSLTSRFDIIIDDGSHVPEDQQWFVANYAQFLTATGLLIVEDIANPDTFGHLAEALPKGFYYGTADLRKPGGLPDSIIFMAWRNNG